MLGGEVRCCGGFRGQGVVLLVDELEGWGSEFEVGGKNCGGGGGWVG